MSWSDIDRVLSGVGRTVGRFTVLALTMALLIVPFAAMFFVCLNAAVGFERLFGGGLWSVFLAFCLFAAVIGRYVVPHVQSPLKAAILALIASQTRN